MNIKVDQHDRKILALLQQDARASHAEIGRRVHLSQPAVSERIKRLEAQGVIAGYRAIVDPAKLGYTIDAVIRIRAQAGRPYEAFAKARPEIVECHTVTGDDCAVLRVLATDVLHLQRIIEELNAFGSTSSAIVLSTQVSHKPISPAQLDE
ncbi:hypothetical protein ABW99_15505 [Pandoraea thiooxydans]|uniref:HTH asnC-type domain-containing protein n=1 Tax=Pandoraea thiooxydans TaxID=445709 RepID=A0A0G3EQU6_9BURK|nr:Lrp/AsnC family transcriptional regulator [Pandoraea thiooxydans]AKJ69413.1 hypothetical protein ABW99_15505 [Pandoraea thiooxydans]